MHYFVDLGGQYSNMMPCYLIFKKKFLYLWLYLSADNSPALQQRSDKLHHESLSITRTRRSGMLCWCRAFPIARGFQLQSVLTNALSTCGICLNIDCAVTCSFKVQVEKEGGILHIHLYIPLLYHIKEPTN